MASIPFRAQTQIEFAKGALEDIGLVKKGKLPRYEHSSRLEAQAQRARMLKRAGKKGVVLTPEKATAARRRHSMSEQKAMKRHSFVQSEFGAAKRFGKTSGQLTKRIKAVSKSLGRKLPVVSLPSQYSEFKSGMQRLESAAKRRKSGVISIPGKGGSI